MTKALKSIKSFAEKQYKQLFGDSNWQLDSRSENLDGPTWIWQSNNLIDVESIETADGALLLDPELGCCLYIVDYAREQDVRETLSRVLATQQRLLPVQRADTENPDELGTWHVSVCWLVDESALDTWIEKLAGLREKTGHFEEIATDVIVGSTENWDDACESYGLPRLLINVRSVLSKNSLVDIDAWRSADKPVVEALQTLDENFKSSLAVECARKIKEHAFSQLNSVSSITRDQGRPKELLSFEAKNFRNLQHLSLHIRSKRSPVSSTIIHGPNGSGKSSIFEAISFAMNGASNRYLNYLEDRNRRMLGTTDNYVADYLHPRDIVNAEPPSVSINEKDFETLAASDTDLIASRVSEMSANIFSQECSKSFVSMPAEELGSEVASAFSGVASAATEYLDKALSSAQEQQRLFNADWGLRGNVVREKTVLERVAGRKLSSFVSPAENFSAWFRFDRIDDRPILKKMTQYASDFGGWSEQTDEIATQLSGMKSSEQRLSLTRSFLADGQALYANAEAFLSDSADRMSNWAPNLEEQIEKFGRWIASRALVTAPSSVELDELRIRQAKLNERLQSVLEQGTKLRLRKSSLDAVHENLPSWSTDNDGTCPICDSEVGHRGGISHIVAQLVLDIDEEILAKRAEYDEVRQTLKDISRQMLLLGSEKPPEGLEDPAELRSQIYWLLLDGDDFEKQLANDNSRTRLIALVAHFRSSPRSRSQAFDLDAASIEVVQRMEDVISEFRQVAALPEAWKSVRNVLRNQLSEVVSVHLPKTVQAVWSEITQNMLPARWQYPGKLSFKVGPSSRSNQLAVVIKNPNAKDALAAHILNGAEVHNLGLSWFLTRYLTDGRFRFQALVLDDPAHAMDQPTYRDFCRLLETLLRLHKVGSIPLSLVVLLHQDSRAIDAARATDGTLHQLRWNKHTPVTLKSFRLLDESSVSPKPFKRLRSA